MKHLHEYKTKTVKTPYKRILLLFCILSLVVMVIVVTASYDDERGYISQTPGYEGQISDSYHEYNDTDAYTGDYLGIDVYTGDSADNLEHNPDPVDGQYHYSNYTQEATATNSSPVSIEIDNNGVIALYPARDNHGVVLDGDYIHVYLPGFYDLAGISATLPDGWTYEVKHEPGSHPSTVITFNHNWNDGGGFIGIMPMVVGNLPTGWSQNTLPVNATIADWNTALAGNTNHVISIPAGHAMPAAVTIPTGRNIVIATSGTDLNGSPTVGHTLAGTSNELRINSNTRHFYISGNATLTLSHIVLDGRNSASVLPPAGTYRGGVQVGTPAETNANLMMLVGSGIQNCRAPEGGGVYVSPGGYITMSGGDILANHATTRGGGVYVNNSTFNMAGGTVGSSADAPQAPPSVDNGNRARYGGGVYMTGDNAVFTVSAGHIAHNMACYGGGVYAQDGSSLTLTSTGVIRNNWRSTLTAWVPPLTPEDPVTGSNRPLHINRGGGVLLTDAGTTFTMTGGTIGGQSFTDTNNQANRAERGGAVAVLDGASFFMEAGTISGNSASVMRFAETIVPLPPGLMLYGAGVYVYGTDSTFNMSGGIIGGIPANPLNDDALAIQAPTGNTGPGRGAGVAVHGGAVFTKDGDGIIAGNCTLVILFGSSAESPGNNQASVGGGVWVGSGGQFNFESGHIIRNRSVNGGGGIRAINGGIVHMTGGYVAGNRTTSAGSGGVSAFTGGLVVMDDGIIGGTNLNGTPIEGNRSASGAGVMTNAFMSVQTESGPVTVPSTFIFNNGTIGGDRTINGGIMSNHATTTGGGVHVQAGAWFHMTGGQIIGNQAPNGGGVFANLASALFSMNGGVIGGTNAVAHHNIATDGAGGAIRATNTGRVLLSEGHIINNRANRGAGVSVGGVGAVLPVSLTAPLNEYTPFIDVYYTTLEGQEERMHMHYQAMQMLSELVDDDLSDDNRDHDHYIGAVPQYYIGTTPQYYGELESESFYHGVEAEGVYHDAEAAESDGNIPIAPSGFVIPPRPVIVEQFRMDGANVIIEGGRNTAGGTTPAAEGGGVHVTGGATYRLLNGIIRDNHAVNGGGVWIGGGGTGFTMTGGTIGHATSHAQGNLAVQGGGVWVGGGATVNMQDYVYIDGNNEEQTTPGTGTIINNTATLTTAATSGGGGVWLTGAGSAFNMSAGTIESNLSQSGGGGVHVHGSGTGALVVFTMTGGEIAYNEATGNQAGMGGAGVRLMNYTARFIMGTEGAPDDDVLPAIRDNEATHSGGGIGIPNNLAGVRSAIVTMHSGLIADNTASAGGGVAIGSSSTFNMLGGTISGNHGPARGGGVTLTHGVADVSSFITGFNMSGGIIESNTATNGGGVSVEATTGNSHFIMTGGTIRNNRYSNDAGTNPVSIGGGVHVYGPNSTFTMSGGYVGGPRGCDDNCEDHANPLNCDPDLGNVAVIGGGVWVGNDASFNMLQGGGGANPITSGTVTGNDAINSGGGVFMVDDSEFKMTGGTISHNAGDSAGGVSLTHTAVFEMSGGTIHTNTARQWVGGGVRITADSRFDMLANTTGGSDPIIRGNTAIQSGGGVNVENSGIFNMHGGTIGGVDMQIDESGDPFNVAANRAINGGGVWVGNGSNFNIHGGAAKHITGNYANNGGGIWVDTNGIMAMQITTPVASNVHITHNTAGGMGGGIFTMNHEYTNPLPPDRIPPPGGTATGAAVAYSNLTLRYVTFAYNTANQRYIPPSNATAVLPANTFLTITAPLPAVPAHVHPLNNFDINFRVFTNDFPFHKTNQHIYNQDHWPTPGIINATLLSGATFSIYRFTGAGTPDTTLVTQAMVTAGTWVYVDTATSTGNPAQPIVFALLPGMYYQLIETSPPPGFQMPMGQWRIKSVARTVGGSTEIGFQVQTISEGIPAPGFVNILPTGIGNTPNTTYGGYFGGTFYLGNWPLSDLPLAGGSGARVFIIAGFGFIFAALMFAVVLAVKRKHAIRL